MDYSHTSTQMNTDRILDFYQCSSVARDEFFTLPDGRGSERFGAATVRERLPATELAMSRQAYVLAVSERVSMRASFLGARLLTGT